MAAPERGTRRPDAAAAAGSPAPARSRGCAEAARARARGGGGGRRAGSPGRGREPRRVWELRCSGSEGLGSGGGARGAERIEDEAGRGQRGGSLSSGHARR